MDQLHARQDKGQPQDNRAQNAPEQDAVLVLQRNPEEPEDHRENEDVVHRQRPFDDVARQEAQRRLAAGVGSRVGRAPPPNQTAECHGHQAPKTGPGGRFSQRRRPGMPVEDEQVQAPRAPRPARRTRPTAKRGSRTLLSLPTIAPTEGPARLRHQHTIDVPVGNIHARPTLPKSRS